ncbi:MAG: hypothetical protein WBQ44_05110 [Rhodococcus sp. (in: high G+C Gram-positive bacteria)]
MSTDYYEHIEPGALTIALLGQLGRSYGMSASHWSSTAIATS